MHPLTVEPFIVVTKPSQLIFPLTFPYISKSPLKEILFKIIPEEYFNRKKQGFSIPIATWLRGPLREWANDLLNSDLINKQDFLSSMEVKKIWESHLNGNSANTELLWTILIWQSWINK